jgi:hypothetical protein
MKEEKGTEEVLFGYVEWMQKGLETFSRRIPPIPQTGKPQDKGIRQKRFSMR